MAEWWREQRELRDRLRRVRGQLHRNPRLELRDCFGRQLHVPLRGREQPSDHPRQGRRPGRAGGGSPHVPGACAGPRDEVSHHLLSDGALRRRDPHPANGIVRTDRGQHRVVRREVDPRAQLNKRRDGFVSTPASEGGAMKTRMQRWLARVALSLVAIAAWGTGATAQSLSGVYGGPKCPYKLTFRGQDVGYMQIKGIAEGPGHYKVEGDKVPVTAGIWSTVFTRKGNALYSLFQGETAVCTELTAAGTPVVGPCEEFGPAYNADNICFDTRPTLVLPQTTLVQVGDKVVEVTVEVSEAKGGSGFGRGGVLGWRPDQAQGAVSLPMPADASVAPTPELLLLRVARDGVTDTAKVLFHSIYVKTFDDAAMDMARSLRSHPARKTGYAVQAW